MRINNFTRSADNSIGVNGMDHYCEFTKEQLEAALNFIRHIQDERAEGRDIDITRLRRVTVFRDNSNRAHVSFKVEYDDTLHAA